MKNVLEGVLVLGAALVIVLGAVTFLSIVLPSAKEIEPSIKYIIERGGF